MAKKNLHIYTFFQVYRFSLNTSNFIPLTYGGICKFCELWTNQLVSQSVRQKSAKEEESSRRVKQIDIIIFHRVKLLHFPLIIFIKN